MIHTLEAYSEFIREASRLLGVRCYLAGGAVRDVLFKRSEQVNDLDLWVYTTDLEATREKALNSGFFGTRKRRLGNERANLGRDGAIQAIDYYEKKGQEINLIYLRGPCSLLGLLRDFDFGVNQAGICPEGGLLKTSYFDEALSHGVLRITREDDPERAEQRLEKMRSKFPTFSVRSSAPKRTSPPKPLDYGYE